MSESVREKGTNRAQTKAIRLKRVFGSPANLSQIQLSREANTDERVLFVAGTQADANIKQAEERNNGMHIACFPPKDSGVVRRQTPRKKSPFPALRSQQDASTSRR